MTKLSKVLRNPKKIVNYLNYIGIFKVLPSKLHLKLLYRVVFRKKLDLNNPKTFNEKLQWLKLYNKKDIYTLMVDKYKVKEYISKIIGEEYIIPTLGVYENFEEINFNDLPNKFVIKCTHDSGGVFLCKDKNTFDYDGVKKKIKSSIKKNYYWHGREWPYKNIKPQIIIEKFMEDDQTKDIRDYKFFCFNGEPKCFKIDFDRFINHRANYYDINKNIINLGESHYPPDFNKVLEMPKNFDQMILLSKKLSKDIPFVRVDFYEINGKVYFGELTFFPSSGFGKFINEDNDKMLGEWLNIYKK